MPLFENQVVVVTGAGRGIGAAVARALADAGAAVVLAARTESSIERIAATLRGAGADAVAVPCDVTVEDDVRRLGDEARRRGPNERVLYEPEMGRRARAEREQRDMF